MKIKRVRDTTECVQSNQYEVNKSNSAAEKFKPRIETPNLSKNLHLAICEKCCGPQWVLLRAGMKQEAEKVSVCEKCCGP